MKDTNAFIIIAVVFAALYFMPQTPLLEASILAGFALMHEYAQQHVLTCLVPAFFIAGAISVFINKASVLKYLGRKSKKYVSYSIASVSGAVLAVCSCTILPMFAGIRQRGAGLGPAVTFLFAGPAINIAAIFLTFSVLGWEIGAARAISAIILSIVIGITMALIFREKGEEGKLIAGDSEKVKASKGSVVLFFGAMLAILVVNGLAIDPLIKYAIMAASAAVVAIIAIFKLERKDSKKWLAETWGFSKMIIPYLFIGVFIVGFVMPLLPQSVIEYYVGGDSVFGTLIASIIGAFMYFSTLTEIPIIQALMAKGMTSGPALSLLLAGPSLSLPSMLVIRRIMGTKKTAVYVLLVIIYSTIAGLIFGSL